jgi:hypothetical protein
LISDPRIEILPLFDNGNAWTLLIQIDRIISFLGTQPPSIGARDFGGVITIKELTD